MTPRTLEAAASVRDWIPAAVERLAAAGCDTPRLDAELLAAGALGIDRARLLLEPELPVPPEAHALLERREAREPVAYILGRRAFRHIELAVDPRVLIPRPETELLVEVALELPRTEGSDPSVHEDSGVRPVRVHDVGTGSGAVALAIKHERPDLTVSASDASPDAVAVARANAEALGLEVELSVADGLPGGDHDLVVANLPYVRAGEIADLAPEIARYEPRSALAAGPDGLDAIRSLVAHARSGTRLALEHAPDQAEAVRALLDGGETRADLAGLPRVTVGRAP